MYVLKNALRNVTRAKGRSILIGIIITIIAFAVCISLCIRQSAADAKELAMSEIEITAQISPDRGSAMEKVQMGGDPGEFDRSQLSEVMGTALTLEELKTYAEAESVKSFYYTMSVSVNASGDLQAYSISEEEEGRTPKGSFGGFEGIGSSADFNITGYSSDEAMTDFVEGTITIEEGQVFSEGTEENVCIISNELAVYNNLALGDIIQVCSTEDEEEIYSLEIVGIYDNSQSSAQAMGMPGGGMGGPMGGFGGFTDPANYIYTSYNALANIIETSESLEGSVNGTYVLGTMEAYEAFQDEVKEMGLSEEYTVSSSDLNQYQQSSQSLESLAKFAGYFLIVVLLIGAIILIVINMFAIRERKYEIGVLTAIGMKKKKVAGLFMAEILIITLLGVVLGGGIGAALASPVTNGLLSTQMTSRQEGFMGMNDAFGRDFGGMPESSATLEVAASVDFGVMIQLLAMCIVLALIASVASVIAIMRYDPLHILSNRD